MSDKSTNAAELIDTLLIGAGPIGIEVAVALKSAGIAYLHVEAGCIGATIAWYAPGTSIFSSPDRLAIAGVPFVIRPQTKATREDYLAYLRAVASQFDLVIRTNCRVISARRDGDGFLCQMQPSAHGVGGPEEFARTRQPAPQMPTESIRVSRIILAIGDMQLARLLNIPGEFLPSVSHYFSDPHDCYCKRVIVVGAKNSAAEAVVRLARVEAHTTVCQRGDGFDSARVKPWLLPEIHSLIAENRVRHLPRVVPVRIEPGRLFVRSVDGPAENELPFERLFLLTGYHQDNSLLRELGVELIGDEKKPTINPETMETNVPGVYVAGTAVAGTQLHGVKVFVENCHRHARLIRTAIAGGSLVAHSADRPVEYREI